MCLTNRIHSLNKVVSPLVTWDRVTPLFVGCASVVVCNFCQNFRNCFPEAITAVLPPLPLVNIVPNVSIQETRGTIFGCHTVGDKSFQATPTLIQPIQYVCSCNHGSNHKVNHESNYKRVCKNKAKCDNGHTYLKL